MISEVVRAKIKRVKIVTQRVMRSALSGDYLSAFKGSGLEFDQIREYSLGDDPRFIDWNNSAKTNSLMVKQYREERDRTIIIAVDISASTDYSSQEERRKELIEQLAASLAFIAIENKDKVGILFFSDKVEQWIPPARGSAHQSTLLESIFLQKNINKKTDIAAALRFLIALKKRGAILFIISDWIDSNPALTKLLKVVSCEYDTIALRIIDPSETLFPPIGLIDCIDPESGACFTLNCSAKTAPALAMLLKKRVDRQKKIFSQYQLQSLDLTVGKPFITPLFTFFRQRTRRQIA